MRPSGLPQSFLLVVESNCGSTLPESNYSASEAEADLGALTILESEGVPVPLRLLKARRKYIEFHATDDDKLGVERSPLVHGLDWRL